MSSSTASSAASSYGYPKITRTIRYDPKDFFLEKRTQEVTLHFLKCLEQNCLDILEKKIRGVYETCEQKDNFCDFFVAHKATERLFEICFSPKEYALTKKVMQVAQNLPRLQDIFRRFNIKFEEILVDWENFSLEFSQEDLNPFLKPYPGAPPYLL